MEKTKEMEPGALKFTVHATAKTSWFAGRRIVEAGGVLSILEAYVLSYVPKAINKSLNCKH